MRWTFSQAEWYCRVYTGFAKIYFNIATNKLLTSYAAPLLQRVVVSWTHASLPFHYNSRKKMQTMIHGKLSIQVEAYCSLLEFYHTFTILRGLGDLIISKQGRPAALRDIIYFNSGLTLANTVIKSSNAISSSRDSFFFFSLGPGSGNYFQE